MQKEIPPHILHHWAFKAAVIVSAFVSMPVIWSLCGGKIPSMKVMLMAWPWVTELMLKFMPYSLPCYAVGVWSILCWWRKPCRRTAIWVFIAIPGLCGVVGIFLMGFIAFCFSTR